MANVTVRCECGKELAENSVQARYSSITITTDPCEDCLDKKEDEGYKRGYDERDRET